jgi:hypothetical protein
LAEQKQKLAEIVQQYGQAAKAAAEDLHQEKAIFGKPGIGWITRLKS